MNKIIDEIQSLKNNLNSLPYENINNLNLKRSEVYIVDMNNGFARSGSLYSPRVEALITPIENFIKHVSNKVHKIVAFTDRHTPESIELQSYPSHCIENHIESEIIDELKSIENVQVIPKNSTNGFFAMDTIDFNNVDNIIIVGDCTDICVYQFAITLKSYFNQNNMPKNIIVPINLVDTYDIPNVHSAELLNLVFLNSMLQNGINVVKEIQY